MICRDLFDLSTTFIFCFRTRQHFFNRSRNSSRHALRHPHSHTSNGLEMCSLTLLHQFSTVREWRHPAPTTCSQARPLPSNGAQGQRLRGRGARDSTVYCRIAIQCRPRWRETKLDKNGPQVLGNGVQHSRNEFAFYARGYNSWLKHRLECDSAACEAKDRPVID